MARHAWLCPARYRVAPRRVMTHLNNVVFNLLNVLPFSYRKTKRNFCRRSPRPQNWRPEDFIIKDWQNSKWLWSNMQKDNYQMLTKFILACRIVCWKCVIFRYQAHKPRFLLPLLDQYKQHSISLSNKSRKFVCSSSYLFEFLSDSPFTFSIQTFSHFHIKVRKGFDILLNRQWQHRDNPWGFSHNFSDFFST